MAFKRDTSVGNTSIDCGNELRHPACFCVQLLVIHRSRVLGISTMTMMFLVSRGDLFFFFNSVCCHVVCADLTDKSKGFLWNTSLSVTCCRVVCADLTYEWKGFLCEILNFQSPVSHFLTRNVCIWPCVWMGQLKAVTQV